MPTPAELERAVAPVVAGLGFELLEIQLARAGRRRILRIVADRPGGGIALGDCAQISRAAAVALEQAGLEEQAYILEVSSPGLDRRLETARDFGRYVGEGVTLQMVDGSSRQGTLAWVGDSSLRLEQTAAEIPLAQVRYGTRNY